MVKTTIITDTNIKFTASSLQEQYLIAIQTRQNTQCIVVRSWNGVTIKVSKCAISSNAHHRNENMVNSSPLSNAYKRQWIGSALVQIMACRLFGAKPSSKPMLRLLSIGPLGTNFNEILVEIQNLSFPKLHLTTPFVKWRPFCPWRDEFMPCLPTCWWDDYWLYTMGVFLSSLIVIRNDQRHLSVAEGYKMLIHILVPQINLAHTKNCIFINVFWATLKTFNNV